MKSLIILLFWMQGAFCTTIKGSFPPPKDPGVPILDAYSFDLDGDGTDELIMTSLNVRDRKAPGPLGVYKYKDKGQFIDVSHRFFKKIPSFFHARHILFIPHFESEASALFVSDHGVDLPSYDGGISKLFVWDSKIKKFVDKTQKYGLEKSRGFTFSSTYTRLKSNQLVLFKSNIMLPKSGPEFLVRNEKNRFENIITDQPHFPRDKCIMNALFVDFDRDGVDELFLGGCDVQKMGSSFLESDLIFKFDQQKLVPWQTLAPRNDEALWGVAAIYAQSMFSSSKEHSLPDLATIIYNPSYTRGKVNFYQNTGSDLKLVGQFTPIQKFPDFFIPWAVVMDLDGDENPEFIGTYRYGDIKPQERERAIKYFVLKNDGKQFFESSKKLDVPEKDAFVNAVKLKINGIEHLAFPTYNGTIYILDRLSLK